ncbi:DUF2384 domain-containing protein [Aquimarina sp. ERC-38]|uniref:antitoxin Xre/MbcA/ParS toxin-binding domain-containing protein n=1 Tax=Aquimarina sp. ERC-38 TaxID=2949996 RepID=UPI002246D159|nr:antitoxin Xre/MbcA/ParS toxin-binding domain-containing protein [Aquimarina sp. ERC-38]UZO81738.1 DUF2384 domain-containing protein [Aquimarina sp. ERC-38]
MEKLDIQNSLKRADRNSRDKKKSLFYLTIDNKNFSWSGYEDKIQIIRKGLPYGAIEALSKRSNIPVKHYLNALQIVQTTYNKKKKAKSILSKKDSEFILTLTELFDYGCIVFNNEIEKFQRWLQKPNISLGGVSPDSLFDSLLGIQQVKNSLDRLEYGNFA